MSLDTVELEVGVCPLPMQAAACSKCSLGVGAYLPGARSALSLLKSGPLNGLR
jgi:hypothetical protein